MLECKMKPGEQHSEANVSLNCNSVAQEPAANSNSKQLHTTNIFGMFGFAVTVALENHAQRFNMCGNLWQKNKKFDMTALPLVATL